MVTLGKRIDVTFVAESKYHFGQVDLLLSKVQSSEGVKKGYLSRKIKRSLCRKHAMQCLIKQNVLYPEPSHPSTHSHTVVFSVVTRITSVYGKNFSDDFSQKVVPLLRLADSLSVPSAGSSILCRSSWVKCWQLLCLTW